jgi:Coenzyme PQQ synthesis protein D (PqqD)
MRYSTHMPKLVSRQFDDEIVIANYENGLYYSITGTGADIWLGLQAGWSVASIVAALATIYPSSTETIASAVPAFVEQLLSEAIIVPISDCPDQQAWSPKAAAAFSPPVLERFDDLRDLLLLDPIHEVGEGGWPVRPGNAR